MTKQNSVNVDAMGDVLPSIINRSWKYEFGEFENPEKVMKTVPQLVNKTFCILEWLGLVERDDKDAFGYKPTRRLMPLLLMYLDHPLKASKKESASIEDEDCLYCIYEAAVPYEKAGRGASHYDMPEKVLYVLGLVRFSQENTAVPTPTLRHLAAVRRQVYRGHMLDCLSG
jgi:hypothetical protein